MLFLEPLPRLPEVHLGVVEGGGAASGLRAGDVNGDVPQPDPRHPLAGEPDAAYGLVVFPDPVIVWADLFAWSA